MKRQFTIFSNGTLPDGIRELFEKTVREFADKKVLLTLELAKGKRSLSANNYYWGVIVETVRQFRLDSFDPVTPKKAHEDLLAEFAPRIERKKLNGDIEVSYMRSSEMSVAEMAKYILAIEGRLSHFGVVLPVKDY